MLDRDLADLYAVKSIRLREQVKRNIERFPENFMFQLTKSEVESMVSQFAIPSKKHLGGTFPYAFTEHGVLMLANVLRSGRALKMSIRIIEIFVRIREMVSTHNPFLVKLYELESKVKNQDQSIREIFSYLKQIILQENQPPTPIGFKPSKWTSPILIDFLMYVRIARYSVSGIKNV